MRLIDTPASRMSNDRQRIHDQPPAPIVALAKNLQVMR
jgi:hypothetical protein